MASRAPFVVGGVAFTALALFTVPRQVRTIQADLQARAERALAGVGAGLNAAVHGRDVVLQGTVADEAQRARARAAVASLWGVRAVDDEMQLEIAKAPAGVENGTRRIGAVVLPTPASAATAHSSSMRVTAQLSPAGVLTLSGQAPSPAARAAIADRARRIFGADKLRDHLLSQEVDERAGWRDAVFAGLAVLQRLERGRMDATAYRIRVGGIAVDAKIEGEIASALRSVAPSDLQVAVDVDAPPRRAPRDATRGVDG